MPISLMCNSAVICGFLVKATDLHSDSGNKVCFQIFANCIYDEYNYYFSWFKIPLLQDYPLHLASSVCEWTVAFSFVCFFLTYINDFKVSITTSNREVNSFFSGLKEIFFFVSPSYVLQLFTLRVKTEYEEWSGSATSRSYTNVFSGFKHVLH